MIIALQMVPGMKLRRLKPCAIPLQCSYDKDVTSVDCNETAELAASVNQVGIMITHFQF
jgi:hypothetical protein